MKLYGNNGEVLFMRNASLLFTCLNNINTNLYYYKINYIATLNNGLPIDADD